jgi:adenylate kinase family enzyme
MYEVGSRTIEVLSHALHDLCQTQLEGTQALKHLVSLLKKHGGLLDHVTTPDQVGPEPEGSISVIQECPMEECYGTRSTDTIATQALFTASLDPCHISGFRGELRQEIETGSDLPESPTEQSPPMNLLPCPHGAIAFESTGRPVRSDDQRFIFVLGGPGSGKGTMCDRLVGEFDFAHLSVGEALREETRSQSELGTQIKQIMEAGHLVPDEIALRIIRDTVTRLMPAQRVILDGFPRTVEQAIAFEQSIGFPWKILWLTCDDSTLVKRILSRGQSSGRPDDNEAAAAERLSTFNKFTAPIRDHYGMQSPHAFRIIDSAQSIDEVYMAVKAALEI